MQDNINFIFLFKNDYPNWCFEGPLTHYIYLNFLYSSIDKIKNNKKNILCIEPTETLKGIINNFDYLINDVPLYKFLIDNNITLLIGCLADPPSVQLYGEFIKKIKSLKLEKLIKIISSNLQISDDFCQSYHHFIEESTKEKHLFFETTQNELGYLSEEINEDELNNFKNKKFLSFNRNIDKQHRYSLLHDFLSNDFSDSLFSFLYLEGIHCFPYQKDYKEISFYKKKLPIHIDTEFMKDFTFKTNNTFKKDIFLDCCINIVTETSFHDNELFLSEKILKPILNYQPYIVLGPVNYLKELKKFGFKTFENYWDESYDDIESPEDRYFAVQKIIFEINKKSIKEINSLYQNLKHICIHNKKNFMNLQCNSIENFFKNL